MTILNATNRMDVRRATEDVNQRTLSGVHDVMARFIYLASMRDYNTGVYHHAGLAMRFSEEVACEALAACHRETYRQLVASSLRGIVEQLERYANTSGTLPTEFISTWRVLQPYRVAVPADSDPISTDLLCSNVNTALSILESRLLERSGRAQGASPRPSPAQ